jgi:hypothetical protein
MTEVEELKLEIKRLKEGRFTEEEFQNLCHTFTKDDAERFCNGCEEYQKLLFGYSPITELREKTK